MLDEIMMVANSQGECSVACCCANPAQPTYGHSCLLTCLFAALAPEAGAVAGHGFMRASFGVLLASWQPASLQDLKHLIYYRFNTGPVGKGPGVDCWAPMCYGP